TRRSSDLKPDAPARAGTAPLPARRAPEGRPSPSNPRSLCQPKITGEVAPATVDVIGRVLRPVLLHVEELDHERRPLDRVGVLLALLRLAGKCEVDLVDPGV